MSGVQLQPSSVLLDVAGAVATLTVNRPRVLNALDWATFDALEETLNRIEADPRGALRNRHRSGRPSLQRGGRHPSAQRAEF